MLAMSSTARKGTRFANVLRRLRYLAFFRPGLCLSFCRTNAEDLFLLFATAEKQSALF